MSGAYLAYPSVTARDSYLKSQALARKAIDLDDRYGPAHFVLATASLHLFDWETASVEFQRAELLNPLVHNYDYSVIFGDFKVALADSQLNIEIDPAN